MSIISSDIKKAVTLLEQEKLVAIPTETVYGLAGNIYSETAVKSIFSTKHRPFYNPLIVHIAAVQRLNEVVADIPEKAQLLADAFWPGPLTLVLPKKEHIPDLITAGKPTVAVRVPNHAKTLALLEELNFPLAAPSANPFGSISPTKPQHVEQYFGDTLEMVLDGGPCERGIESTIVGFDGGEPIIYRLGSIPVEAIEVVVGEVRVLNKKKVKPDAPGMLERHYAPKTKTVLCDDLLTEIANNKGQKIGVLSFKTAVSDPEVTQQRVLSPNGDLKEAAANLYLFMHELDEQDLDVIIAEKLPECGLGTSINDRLGRATK